MSTGLTARCWMAEGFSKLCCVCRVRDVLLRRFDLGDVGVSGRWLGGLISIRWASSVMDGWMVTCKHKHKHGITYNITSTCTRALAKRTRRRRCRGGGPHAGPWHRRTRRTCCWVGLCRGVCVGLGCVCSGWVGVGGGVSVSQWMDRTVLPSHSPINLATPPQKKTYSSQLVSISASVGCCELSPGPSEGPVLAEAAFGSAAMLELRVWLLFVGGVWGVGILGQSVSRSIEGAIVLYRRRAARRP